MLHRLRTEHTKGPYSLLTSTTALGISCGLPKTRTTNLNRTATVPEIGTRDKGNQC